MDAIYLSGIGFGGESADQSDYLQFMRVIYEAHEVVILSIRKASPQVDDDVFVRQGVIFDLNRSWCGNQKIIDGENGYCASSALGLRLVELV